MNTRINQFKKLAFALIGLLLFGLVILNSVSVPTLAREDADVMAASLERPVAADATDIAAVYKDSKCLMCHGATAAKFFNTTLSDDALVEIVMKGKKAEKPPNMPGYEEKGMTIDQAKALVAYMRSLRQ